MTRSDDEPARFASQQRGWRRRQYRSRRRRWPAQSLRGMMRDVPVSCFETRQKGGADGPPFSIGDRPRRDVPSPQLLLRTITDDARCINSRFTVRIKCWSVTSASADLRTRIRPDGRLMRFLREEKALRGEAGAVLQSVKPGRVSTRVSRGSTGSVGFQRLHADPDRRSDDRGRDPAVDVGHRARLAAMSASRARTRKAPG